MIWKEKPRPKDYEYRERVEFAWLPRKVDAGLVVWLESVRIREMYLSDRDGGAVFGAWLKKNAWPERHTPQMREALAPEPRP